MLTKTRVAIVAAVLGGIAVLGVAPAQAHTPIGTHIERIYTHVEKADAHVDRAVDDTLYGLYDFVDISIEDVGDAINETGKTFNRTLNPR